MMDLERIRAAVKREERERTRQILQYGIDTGRNDLAKEMYLTCQDLSADEVIAFMERIPVAGISTLTN